MYISVGHTLIMDAENNGDSIQVTPPPEPNVKYHKRGAGKRAHYSMVGSKRTRKQQLAAARKTKKITADEQG